MAANELIPWINSAGEGGVRNSMQEFPGAGTNGPFEFNFAGGYIDQSHVKAYRYDPVSAQTYTQTLTFVGPNQVTTSDVIPVGQFVIVYRDTPKDQPLVDYSEGAVMDEANLDKSNQQAVFAAAEMVDRFDSINATSSEAINRSVLALNTANTALDNSHAAQADAAAATTTANNADSHATQALNTANAASATANAIDGKAQSALDASAAAVTTANNAAATANAIDGKAQQALDTANASSATASAANTKADNAVATANGVSSVANNANTKSDQAIATANNAASAASTAQSTANTAQITANNAQTSANNANTNANNRVSKGGDTMTGRLTMAPSGASGEIGFGSPEGYRMYIRGRSGGGLEFINNAYNAIPMWVDDGGRLSANGGFATGNAQFNNDGNIYMPWAGNWLSNVLGGKAGAGAQCQRREYVEFGSVGPTKNGAATEVNLGAPWVLAGLRLGSINGPSGDCIGTLYLRGTWLVNQ